MLVEAKEEEEAEVVGMDNEVDITMTGVEIETIITTKMTIEVVTVTIMIEVATETDKEAMRTANKGDIMIAVGEATITTMIGEIEGVEEITTGEIGSMTMAEAEGMEEGDTEVMGMEIVVEDVISQGAMQILVCEEIDGTQIETEDRLQRTLKSHQPVSHNIY